MEAAGLAYVSIGRPVRPSPPSVGA
jgi:hypothetical protein